MRLSDQPSETGLGEIRPITMPGVHLRAYRIIKEILSRQTAPKILDAGAGHGALTKRLFEDGYDVVACDINPEYFLYQNVVCVQADITDHLPFDDEIFDMVLFIEVMEHIHNHKTPFKECYRVLKPGGIFFFSTPNIVSLKSRIRFFYAGFPYAFKPLDYSRFDGLQHVAALTVDQYKYLTAISGFSRTEISIDKRQRTSVWLLFFVPLLWLGSRFMKIPYRNHNSLDLLTGRLLFFKITK